MKSIYQRLKTIKKHRENKETYIREFNKGGKAFSNIKCAFNANILINDSGILYNTAIISEYFFIRIENIKKLQVKTDEELSKRVIANKRRFIGDLTFPRQTHFFLIISYIENNLEVEKTIESEMAVLGATGILKARQQYLKKHPNIFLEEIDYTLEATVLKDEPKTVDIPDQIDKLFQLVGKGALSLEEFNEKKKELLSKL